MAFPPEDAAARSVGLMAFVGLSVAIFMLLVPLPFEGRAGAVLGDVAHAPLFGSITIATLFLWHRLRPLDSFGREWYGRMALVAVCVFLGGILMEFAQTMTGRTAALHDAIANGLGVIAAVAICFALLNLRYHSQRRWVSVIATGVAMSMVGVAMARPVQVGMDIVAAHQAFPMLGSFESEMELTRWYFDDCLAERTDEHTTDGNHSLRILVRRSEHPAATLIETVPDWSDVKTLELDVTLAGSYPTSLEMVLKVMDEDRADYHADTSRKSFALEPGKTTHLVMSREEILTGPDTRNLDLTRIQMVSLQLISPQTSSFVDIDRIVVTR
ncbi:VanZ family protein [Aporhodopirellula aestuarii]|uniref:VanZ-like domain-containing protein n=1 Tax=Aporhodopirellula aestuarii TaxID=2950107 RepID=A0ABT0U5K1_9BACT|nr:hypothetical protein [Aporhodopirellula aestuarii]MCM2372214.1 hypothetical protein [Aporhodopirellula aestuarii]